MGDLSKETPYYSGDLNGNYYDLAECTKAQQAKAFPMVRMDLLHDKASKEATVTWNHEFGAMNAFVFRGVDATHTRLNAYSAVSSNQALVKFAEGCQAALMPPTNSSS